MTDAESHRDPGSERALRFEPASLRRAYVDAGNALVECAAAVPAPDWTRPGLGEWTVRDLVGHAGRAFVTVSHYLATGAGRAPTLNHPLDYGSAYRTAGADPRAIAERGRQAGRDLGDDPVAGLRSWRDAAVADLAAYPDAAPVATPAGVMRLIDYLPSRILELVVHTDDLAQVVGPVAMPTSARMVATCFAAGLATERGVDLVLLRALTGRGALEHGFTVL